MQIPGLYKNDLANVFPLFEAEHLVVRSKCLASSTQEDLKTKAQVFRPQGIFFFPLKKKAPRRQAGSRGWEVCLNPPGKALRRKRKQTLQLLGFVLFSFRVVVAADETQ